ncbi:MAG TPA: YbaK/EbsC family protein [Arenicellales bacterium]|nr:YbaK/EbsC family protein [Arenicellales bacterium]
MPITRLQNFLDHHQVKYLVINHSPAYTARETAASTLMPRREFAKAVLLKLDGGELVMAVVPASRHVDLNAVAEAAGSSTASLAEEDEFESRFPGCESGAAPPFGNLFDVPVYADRELMQEDDLAFNAGTHTQVVRLPARDYLELVKPVLGNFAVEE